MSNLNSSFIAFIALSLLAIVSVVVADDCYPTTQELHADVNTVIYYPTNGVSGDEDDCTLNVAPSQTFPAVILLQGGRFDQSLSTTTMPNSPLFLT